MLYVLCAATSTCDAVGFSITMQYGGWTAHTPLNRLYLPVSPTRSLQRSPNRTFASLLFVHFSTHVHICFDTHFSLIVFTIRWKCSLFLPKNHISAFDGLRARAAELSEWTAVTLFPQRTKWEFYFCRLSTATWRISNRENVFLSFRHSLAHSIGDFALTLGQWNRQQWVNEHNGKTTTNVKRESERVKRQKENKNNKSLNVLVTCVSSTYVHRTYAIQLENCFDVAPHTGDYDGTDVGWLMFSCCACMSSVPQWNVICVCILAGARENQSIFTSNSTAAKKHARTASPLTATAFNSNPLCTECVQRDIRFYYILVCRFFFIFFSSLTIFICGSTFVAQIWPIAIAIHSLGCFSPYLFSVHQHHLHFITFSLFSPSDSPLSTTNRNKIQIVIAVCVRAERKLRRQEKNCTIKSTAASSCTYIKI